MMSRVLGPILLFLDPDFSTLLTVRLQLNRYQYTMAETPEDDLNDLDSLLDELDDEILSKPPGATIALEQDGNSSKDVGDDEEVPEMTVEENFQALLKEMNENDPNLAEQLTGFLDMLNSEEGEQVRLDLNNNENKNFEDIVSDTMHRLKTSGKDVDKQIHEEQSGDPVSELLRQLGGLSTDDVDESNGEIGDVLLEMLNQLTSKSVLYEPLKDLHTKFPKWLQENKGKISESEFLKYEQQYSIVNDIVSKFEDTKYDTGKDSEYINEKLEKLQDLGMPPQEIMNSDLGGLPGFSNNFTNDEIPDDVEKQLEESCKQQ